MSARAAGASAAVAQTFTEDRKGNFELLGVAKAKVYDYLHSEFYGNTCFGDYFIAQSVLDLRAHLELCMAKCSQGVDPNKGHLYGRTIVLLHAGLPVGISRAIMENLVYSKPLGEEYDYKNAYNLFTQLVKLIGIENPVPKAEAAAAKK